MGIYNTTDSTATSRGLGATNGLSTSDTAALKAAFPKSPLYIANAGNDGDLKAQAGKSVSDGDGIDSVNKFYFIKVMQGRTSGNTQMGETSMDFEGGTTPATQPLPLGSISDETDTIVGPGDQAAADTDPAGAFVPNVRVGEDPQKGQASADAYQIAQSNLDGKSGDLATTRGVKESSDTQGKQRLGSYLLGKY